VLTQAIKEQQAMIAQQQVRIEQLEKNIKLNAMDATENKGVDVLSAPTNFLDQNVPNPFTTATTITYRIGTNFTRAQLGVYDRTGAELKLFEITDANGVVRIEADTLKPGMYLYSLIIDGIAVDTKKMTLTSH
jgi:hypothetical protein